MLMKKIALLAVAIMLTAVISSAQEKVRIDSWGKDTVKVPTYEELTRMVSRMTARVDSARQMHGYRKTFTPKGRICQSLLK